MKTGDWVKLTQNWQNQYKVLYYTDNEGQPHYNEDYRSFSVGQLGKIVKLNKRQGLALVDPRMPSDGMYLYDVPLDHLEVIPRYEADLLMREGNYQKHRQEVENKGKLWDEAIDYAGVPIGEVPRVLKYGKMVLPRTSRGYFGYSNEWIAYRRPEWQQRWTDAHERVTRRIRLAAASLDYLRYEYNKVFFRANPDNLDLQRISTIFADDLPTDIKFSKSSSSLWWSK